MTHHVELIYNNDCPHIDAARTALWRAFAQAGAVPTWVEWDLQALDKPDHIQGYGSPTILVNGRDIAELEPTTGAAEAECCRLYKSETGGLRGVPPVAQIVTAMQKSNRKPRGRETQGLN